MQILVTGTSGLIGSALVPFLTQQSHQVISLVRRTPKPGAQEIFWDPADGRLDAASLEGFDAVVHLAGASIAEGRWTARRKKLILDSRVNGTRLLARKLAGLRQPPSVMISTSAVGYYGNRGDEILREESKPGHGFLADVCSQWELAAGEVVKKGTRLVVLRLGMVLSASGGALPRMLPPFRLGIGGRLGNGSQFMSWIALDDLLEIILCALGNPLLQGAINAVAPEPITNLEFTKTLGCLLGRPTLIPVPALAIRWILGEMGEQVLLASARVEPAGLVAAGFRFRYPILEQALRRALAS